MIASRVRIFNEASQTLGQVIRLRKGYVPRPKRRHVSAACVQDDHCRCSSLKCACACGHRWK